MLTRQPRNFDPYLVLEESTKNTPDWSTLKKDPRDEFPVLITGAMRRNGANNKWLAGCNYYGNAVTWGDKFIMNRPRLHSEVTNVPDPLVFYFDSDKTNWKEVGEYFDPNDMKAVEGDVYGVPLRRLASLDIHEGNTDGIKRELVYVTLMNPIQHKTNIKAFLYTVDIPFYMESFSPHAELDKCRTIEFIGNRYSAGVEAYCA